MRRTCKECGTRLTATRRPMEAVQIAAPHPHPDPRHIMTTYRRHILTAKRQFRTARGLGKYMLFIQYYLWAKRTVCAGRKR